MTRQSVPSVGSYEEARQFQLRISLRLTPAERLRDLEAMWDFNDAAEAQNPRLRRIVELLRERRLARGG